MLPSTLKKKIEKISDQPGNQSRSICLCIGLLFAFIKIYLLIPDHLNHHDYIIKKTF